MSPHAAVQLHTSCVTRAQQAFWIYKNAEGAEPLSPAREGQRRAPAGTAPTGCLSVSYLPLPSLNLALAQWEGRLCDGHVVLLDPNHSDLSCGMEHSVGNFLSTAACLKLYLHLHESCNVFGW